LLNDILDFAQLKSEKFRKDMHNFNVKDSIQEIMLVQQYKAEQKGIDMILKMENFPTKFDDKD
jgi:signal transduction histidine kinase